MPEGAGFADAERAANAVVAAHPALRLRLRIEHGARTPRARATAPAGLGVNRRAWQSDWWAWPGDRRG